MDLIIQRTKRLFNKLNILPWYAGTSYIFCSAGGNFFFYGSLTEELNICHFLKLIEKCAKGSSAKWSRISHIPNMYFDESIKHEAVWRSCTLLRWMTSKFSLTSSSFLRLYSPFPQNKSIFHNFSKFLTLSL